MGKNWRGGSGGGRGGGGRGGRGGGRGGGSNNDTSSCKGHGAIIGTCDAARERETSKEMVNLLNQAIEIMCPTSTTENEYLEPESTSSGGGSVKDMLAQEIAQVRKQRHTATQNVMSVDTKVKGLVLIKIMRKDLCPVDLVKTIFDRVRKEKEPCSRHVVRLIPLQRVFYPNNNDLSDKVASIILCAFPGAVLPHFEKEIEVEVKEASDADETTEDRPVMAAECEGSLPHDNDESNVEQQNKRPRTEPTSTSSSDEVMLESVIVDTSDIYEQRTVDLEDDEAPLNPALVRVEEGSCATTLEKESCQAVHELSNASVDVAPATFYPPLFYSALFKARSHNLMTRESVQAAIAKTVPTFFRPTYKRAKAVLVVEALRNICGASLLKDGYGDYEEFNLKKFQLTHCANSAGSNLTNFKSTDKGKNDTASYYGRTDSSNRGVSEDEIQEVEDESAEDQPKETPVDSIDTDNVPRSPE